MFREKVKRLGNLGKYPKFLLYHAVEARPRYLFISGKMDIVNVLSSSDNIRLSNPLKSLKKVNE